MATPFTTACGVSITNSYDTVGTLTRASIKVLTPDEVKALFTDGTQWHEMSSLLKAQFEMRMCGVRRYGLYDWIMSSNKPGMSKLIDIHRQHKGPSLIQPFIIGRQLSVVNADYWAITCGVATTTGAYTPHVATVACVSGTSMTGPLTANEISLGAVTGDPATSDRVIRVISSYGVTLDAKYFLAGHFVYHLNRSALGVAQHGQWKILAAHVAADGTFIDVLIKSFNTISTTTVDALPLTGLILLGANLINDVESYCKNFVNYSPEKRVPFWYDTYRWGRRVDSTYEETFQKLLEDNKWFEAFQDIPMAERNRQDEITRQKQWVNDFFFSRAISSNQTLALWGSLDQITSITGATVDPGTGSQLIAYRAKKVGVYEQLKACTRVIDVQNQALNIQTFAETYIYDIVRSRKGHGRPATSIDVYTDSTTAAEFQAAFIAYYKSIFGDIIALNVDVTEGGHEEFGFQWKSFKLPAKPFGVTVNIITHEFFDDMRSTFAGLGTGDQGSRGRFLAILDLGKGGSIYPAILATNRKTWLTGEIEKLAAIDVTFSCAMENPTIKTTLNSETSTAIVECPLDSLWVENFASIVMP